MRLLLLTALIVGAGAIGGAAAASAPPGTLVAMPRFVPVAGPLIAGPDRLAWVTRRDDAVLDLWVSEPGAGPRRVQRFSGSDAEELRAPRLTASAAGVTLALRVTDRRGRTLRTLRYGGAFGEPLTPGAASVATATQDPWPGHAVDVSRGCESVEIRTLALAGEQPGGAVAAQGAAAEPDCALRLRRPLRLHGRRLRLGVSCAGFRIDCSARVTIRAGGRVVARGRARYNHATPPYAAASLRVTRSERALLRRAKRIRVTARLTDPSLDGTVTRHTIRQLPAALR